MGLKRIVKKSNNALMALQLSIKRQGYRLSALSATGRFLELSRQFGYEPTEAFRLGFLDSRLDRNQLASFLSRKHTTRLQKALNPPTLAGLFKNKAAFYHQCRKHDLPIPKLYAVYSTPSKTIHLCNTENWPIRKNRENLFDALPERFAIKPVEGSLGNGFKIITRLANNFKDHNDIVYNPSQFLRLLAGSGSVGTLMQEVIENHPAITSLSDAAGLQTVRIITLADADGRVEILTAFLKTITQTHIVIDTHIENYKGNLEVLIDLSEGSLGQASYLDGTGKGIVILNNHPLSGKPFKGFVIPYWTQVCELANRAALTALPVRCIGWDIAITSRGPCLIEGNIWWDPPNQHRIMGRIAERMESVIATLSGEYAPVSV